MHFVSGITSLLFAAAVLAKPIEIGKRGVITSTSTTCSYTSKQPSPTPLICGKEGMITRIDSTIMKWEPGNEANKCLSYCKITWDCVSYSWNSTSNVCMYYNAAIKASNFTMTGKSNTRFWNKRCFGQGCSTTTITLTSTTSSSTSSISSSTSSISSSTSSISSSTSSKSSSTSSKSSSTSSKSSSTSKTSTVKTTTSTSPKTTTTTTKLTTTTTPKITTTTSPKATTITTVKTTTTITTQKVTTTTTTTKKSTNPTTTKAISTCTSTPDLSVDNCNAITVSLGFLASATFTLYYEGTSTIEAPLSGSKTVLIPNVNSICDAAKACANQGALLGIASLYSSFDLHYLTDSCEFECVLQVMPNLNGGAFNVSVPEVGASVGFSVSVGVGL